MAGKNYFARPIGQYIVAEVLKLVGIRGKSIEDAIDAIMSNISMDIDQAPWVGVIWNSSTQRIMGGKAERGLITAMISHALGLRINIKVRELKQKYRDTIEEPKATLLSPISWSGSTLSTSSENEEQDTAAEDENE